ncbi:MAG: methyltransferase domain-containing protein [Pseudonocardiales bacterium]|nr:methyltransferase domain-containing protein [Pseudonocardiales bacterium]
MPSYPTDLNPSEQRLAQTRLRELAETFTEAGALRTPAWREVFQRTWRHPYIPSYYPDPAGPCLLSIDPQRRGEWLAAVYSDQTLGTKVVQVPMPRALRPGTAPILTSSSTLPSLVLRMLEELDVTDGHRVLEIGTGTGYNAALLCERLGSEYVTSVDIDPELIELAAERLAANGYTPTLAAVDGAGGYPPGAPYDRIIATCSVPAIPPAWLEQTSPGAVILADVHGKIGGTLARLIIDGEGIATGRFLPLGTAFMWLRHALDFSPPPMREPEGEPMHSVTTVDPTLLHTSSLFGFVAQWHLLGGASAEGHLPEVAWSMLTDNGASSVHLQASDGSRASVHATAVNGEFPVTQYGPSRLWDRVEDAHEFWHQTGQPPYSRFGITATATEQYVWYDHPDSEHRWRLPTPTLPRTTGYEASVAR